MRTGRDWEPAFAGATTFQKVPLALDDELLRDADVAIVAAVGRVVAAGAVPVVLGGDHSIAYPDVAAVAAALPEGSLAVVQFDTHTDTASENWGVLRAHGTPFRHLVDEGVLPGHR